VQEDKPIKVLLVEDDDDIRKLLEAALGERFDVASACSGRDAASAMLTVEPDIMLADLELPGLCGEALALRAQALAAPPVVFLMSGDHERLGRARRLARETIRKPFSIREIVDTLEASHSPAAA
jgi:DNA-binding response OmpR family regulator